MTRGLYTNKAGATRRILTVGPSRPVKATACPEVPWWVFDAKSGRWFEERRRVFPGMVRWEVEGNADERDRFLCCVHEFRRWLMSERTDSPKTAASFGGDS